MKRLLLLLTIMLSTLVMSAQLVNQTLTFDAENDSVFTVNYSGNVDVSAYIKVYNEALYGTKDGYVYIKGADRLGFITHTIDSIAVDSTVNTWETYFWTPDKLILDFEKNNLDSGTVKIDIVNFRLY